MIGIAISNTRDNGTDVCVGQSGRMNSWENIRDMAKEMWTHFPGLTISVSAEMRDAFITRLNAHCPNMPDKPVMARGAGEMPDVPQPETVHEFGGFTLTYNHQHMIVFRYNIKLHTREQMTNDLNRIYFIEFVTRKKLNDPDCQLVPASALEVVNPGFMVPLPRGGIFINFWNHTMENNIRERFCRSFSE